MEDEDPFRLSSYIHRTSGFKVSSLPNNCSLYIKSLSDLITIMDQ